MKRIQRFITFGVLGLMIGGTPALATQPPVGGGRFPRAYYNRIRQNPRVFTYRNALQQLVQRVRATRLLMSSPGAPAAAPGPVAVTGKRRIPVLPFKFQDARGQDPFDVSNLQKELFDGPWATGTMTDYYKEISYGAFEVTGTVMPWKTLSRKGSFYAGTCNGLCGTARVPAMLKEALDANASIDWGQYDNDGADGQANSGDDDGFVDFVAFVQPQSGGECGSNPNIWSHRSNLTGWNAPQYTTRSPRKGGGFIKINDYVIMPGVACDKTTMIQIGVFAHEFGHAFGLPDLYDTDPDNGDSEGIGNWCLMAAGSWGADGHSPERPVHMSAWAKSYLGWVRPAVLGADQPSVSAKRAEDNAIAFKVPILGNGGLPTKQYYLIENRQATKFDEKLPVGGLLIWKINDAVVEPGLQNNTVNADATNEGVALIQADNLNQLEKNLGRGDAGDPYPGKTSNKAFDNVSAPKSIDGAAVCSISDAGATMTFRFSRSGRCQTTPPAPAAAGTAGRGSDDQAQKPATVVSLSEVADHPERFLNKTVTVSGRLENEGRNYFTDRRLVLKGGSGAASKSLPVSSVPAVAETPPAAPEAARGRPRTMANFLGKNVNVTAVIEKDDTGRYVLAIKSLTTRK